MRTLVRTGFLALGWAACVAEECPVSFVKDPESGLCLQVAGTDTGGGDADTDSDTDADADADTDSGTFTGLCAPTDSWTGAIPTALYTTTPYDASYDAGLEALATEMYNNPSGSNGGESFLVTGATVSALRGEGYNYVGAAYIEDAAYSIVVVPMMSNIDADIGDKVGFATDYYGSIQGERQAADPIGWTVMSSGNPVYVQEAGPDPIDYSLRLNQVTHAYGELRGASANDCGAGYACYILAREGTDDLVRVDVDLDDAYGLGADYDGGLCGEVVAPISVYLGTTGEVAFYDILTENLMRTWSGP